MLPRTHPYPTVVIVIIAHLQERESRELHPKEKTCKVDFSLFSTNTCTYGYCKPQKAAGSYQKAAGIEGYISSFTVFSAKQASEEKDSTHYLHKQWNVENKISYIFAKVQSSDSYFNCTNRRLSRHCGIQFRGREREGRVRGTSERTYSRAP